MTINEIAAIRAATILTILCGMTPFIGLITFMVWQNAKGRDKQKCKPKGKR